MRIFGLTITRQKVTTAAVQKAAVAVTQWPTPANGWFGVLRERFAGAWQRGIVAPVEDVMAHATAWACYTLIASDIAKLRITLVAEDSAGICTEVTNNAYTPVLTKPNHYQNRIQFVLCWILSKLTRGNAYILKERDNRGGPNKGNVIALYVLDPARVQVLVAPNGDVFYQLATDYLSGITEASIVVPAREIIHDIMIPLYHPLVGVSSIHACGRAIMQGLRILANTDKLFQNGSQPGGVLTAPGQISDEAAARIQKRWDAEFSGEDNVGKVAVLGDGLTFEPMAMTAVDAQLIDQLKWGDEKVCAVNHVPPYMVGVGPAPTYNNIEALNQQYYTQCLQSLIEALELCLFEGLEISAPLGIELDLDGLLRMDSATKMKTVTDGVKGGIYTPNEGRFIFNKKPLKGGDTVYLQEQDHALEALANRDAGPNPFGAPAAPKPAQPPEPVAPAPDDMKDLRELYHGFEKALAA